jgi:methionyl-tRNA formyltransferase
MNDSPRAVPVVFFGTAEFACPSLTALARDPRYHVLGVVTQPDRPRGRDLRRQPPPVKQTALTLGLPVWQPEKCRDPEFIARLAELAAEVFIVAAYGQILPPRLLELPRHGCLNLHGSLLPRHRGAAPIQWALAEGDPETGVTLMRMDAGLDTGDIVAMARTPIRPDDDAQSLHDRLAALGAELLLRTLPDYLAGRITPRPQPAAGVTHARKITREDGRLDWTLPAVRLARRIRAFTPWPGAFALLPTGRRRRVKILAAEAVEHPGQEAPGTVLRAEGDHLRVACGEGALQIRRVQREGGRPLSVAAFLAGCPLRAGQILE